MRSLRGAAILWSTALAGCAGTAPTASATTRVLWVGATDTGVLPRAWRGSDAVVRVVPPRSEWWARRLVLDGFRPDAVVFAGRAIDDPAVRGAWVDMARRRMGKAPAAYLHAKDPVDGVSRGAWLERTDSAGSAGLDRLDHRSAGLDTVRVRQVSLRQTQGKPSAGGLGSSTTGGCDRIRRYGDWEKAGVLADPSRWLRLSETPAERLLPCADGDAERQAVVARGLRDALPTAPRLDPKRHLRVVLDVGHFLRNDSAPVKGQGMVTPRGVDEFVLNRKAALALAVALRDSLGADVAIYNADGAERTLRGRTLAARRMDADVFLSIHHDAVSEREASRWVWNGIERLYCDSVRGFSLHVHDSSVNFRQAFSLARFVGQSLRSGGRVPNLHHAVNGRALLDSADAIYRSDFGVLLSARMPAILVECGVALNRDEELVLDSDSGRADFARLFASGAKRWIGAGAPEAIPAIPPP